MAVPKTRLAVSGHIALRLIAVALLIAAGVRLYAGPTARPVPLVDRHIANIDFQDVPVERAIAQLGTAAGVKVVFDRAALAKTDVALDQHVSLRLHDVKLGVAFELLVESQPTKCVLEQVGDELHVEPFDAVPSVVKVYDVRDLVRSLMESRVDPPAAPETVLNSTSNNQQQNPQGGGSLFGSSGGIGASVVAAPAATPPDPQQETIELIVRVIQDTVESSIWADSGGKEAISGHGGYIMASGGAAVHRQIAAALQQLREADGHASH
jgi:hypothetical protein